MPTKIILIRHGSTVWSPKKKYSGLTDIDLNARGKKQAKKLFLALRKEKIHKVYSSDARRTLDFTSIAFKGLSIEKVAELREINFGIFEGLTYRQIMEKYPKIYTKWLDNPFRTTIPNGEDLNDFKKRVEKILGRILSLNRNKTLAIVTHDGPIKIIIGDILKSKDIWKIKADLASISIIEFSRGKAKIKLLNDTTYLDG